MATAATHTYPTAAAAGGGLPLIRRGESGGLAASGHYTATSGTTGIVPGFGAIRHSRYKKKSMTVFTGSYENKNLYATSVN